MQIDVTGTENGLCFTGSEITSTHFGGNLLFDRDRAGADISTPGPSPTFDNAVRLLGITGIRYPGGTLAEKYFDLNNPNRSLQNFNQTNLFDPDRNGPQTSSTLGLISALEFCAEENLSFTFVLPTFRYLSSQEDCNGNRFEAVDIESIENFVTYLLTEANSRGVSVAGIEIGNEWWVHVDGSSGEAMSAIEYGRVASKLAATVQRAIDQFVAHTSLSDGWHEPEIVVQVGPGGAAEWVTIDGNKPPNDYAGSLVKATALIYAEFNTQLEQAAVDGLVTHRYLTGSIENIDGWAYKPFDTWSSLSAGNSNYKALSRYVTEWNVSASNRDFSGLDQPRALVALLQEMIEAGVDNASIWGIQQNNTTRLTLNTGLSGEAFGGLTAAGEVFKLMAESLVGLKSLQLDVAQPGVDAFGFGNLDRAVLYICNSGSSAESYAFDAHDLTGEFTHVWVKKIHFGAGQVGSSGEDVWVSTLPMIPQNGDGIVYFALEPDELVEISITYGDTGVSMVGSERDDTLSGSNYGDTIYGGSGADLILSGVGDDLLLGGSGSDTLAGGAGSDRLFGGDGFDFADYRSSTGPIKVDLQFMSANSLDAKGDTFEFIEGILGGNYNDDLRGNGYSNEISGGSGSDFIYGRGGNDVISGGDGNDVIWGGEGADDIDGGAGRDRVQYSEAKSGVLVDLAFSYLNSGEAFGDRFISIEDIYGSSFNDRLRGDGGNNIIWGGAGMDSLQGRGGNDILYGGIGADTFYFAKGWGMDKIVDFEDGVDQINLVGFGLTVGNCENYFHQVGADLYFDYGSNRLIIVNSNFNEVFNDLNFI